MHKFRVIAVYISMLILSALLLIFYIKGDTHGLTYFQKTLDTRVGGPFESSSSTSRFALTKAIADQHTVFLDSTLATFAAPDVTQKSNKYFSIFMPGLSFIILPFYFLGKLAGIPQVVTFFSTVIFAVINLALISMIAKKLGAGWYSSLLSGLAFLFSTNALPYALTLNQHHATLSLLLIAILLTFGQRTLLKNLFLGVVFGLAVSIDIPNIFLFAPIMIYGFLSHININQLKDKIEIKIKLSLITILLGILPLAASIALYNKTVTGFYFTIGQTLGRNTSVVAQNQPKEKTDATKLQEMYESHLALKTRGLLNGLYILLVSDERGILIYSPIAVISIFGMIVLYKKKKFVPTIILCLSIILTSLLLYGMFGDPWGGWSFGPRYLIPATGILCIFLGVTISSKKYLFQLVVICAVIYGTFINSLSALTTTAVPPKQEADVLITPIPYTYKYNWSLYQKKITSSYIYDTYISKYISHLNFLYLMSGIPVLMISALILFEKLNEKTENE